MMISLTCSSFVSQHSLITQINWNKYLSSLLDHKLSDEEEVIVNVPTFFAKIDKLLTEVDSKLVSTIDRFRLFAFLS